MHSIYYEHSRSNRSSLLPLMFRTRYDCALMLKKPFDVDDRLAGRHQRMSRKPRVAITRQPKLRVPKYPLIKFIFSPTRQFIAVFAPAIIALVILPRASAIAKVNERSTRKIGGRVLSFFLFRTWCVFFHCRSPRQKEGCIEATRACCCSLFLSLSSLKRTETPRRRGERERVVVGIVSRG